ncbi:MAG: hypothetical protein J5701_06520 [Bacteroidales bacterium]|nr:hypothetical protein [Bacteroidales bacterium]
MQAKFLISAIAITISALCFGQNTVSPNYKGFDFYFTAGCYWGAKTNAGYYKGIPNPKGGETDDAQPNLNLILENKYYREDIKNLILDNNHGIVADEFTYEGSENMHYKTGFIFEFGVKYHFTKNIALALIYSQVRLTATGLVSLGMNSSNINTGGTQYFNYPIIGKEIRNLFGLGITYMFRNDKKVYPFIEIGGHINSVKIRSCDLAVEGVAFDMIDRYGGTPYVPNTDRTEVDPMLGGVGGGGNISLGVRIAFNSWAAIEPFGYISIEKLKLTGYDQIYPNFAVGVRIVMGDRLFSSKMKEYD